MSAVLTVHAVLYAWIVLGASLFAFLPPARAFALVYVIGLLALPYPSFNSHNVPHGMIYFTYSVRLDEFTACNAAALVGTLLFHPRVLADYCFDWLDLSYVVILMGDFVTPVVNHLGAYDGASNVMGSLLRYLPLIFFAKVYIKSMADVMEVLRALIGGAFIYGLLGAVEWRLSPIFNYDLYGYYQHGFAALARWGHFRPVMMTKNALQYGFFMGAMTVSLAWLWWSKLFIKPLWGLLPAPVVFCGLALGLLCSMTVGAYFITIVGLLAYIVYRRVPRRWLMLVLPVLALAWMYGRYAQVIHTPWLVSVVHHISAKRSASLNYRFRAEDAYIGNAHQSMLLGLGGFARGFLSKKGGMPFFVDSFWLIISVNYGLIGLTARLVMWSVGIVAAWKLWPLVPRELRPLMVMVAILFGLMLVDCCVNANLDELFLILAFGMLSVAHRAIRTARQPIATPRPYAVRRVTAVATPG